MTFWKTGQLEPLREFRFLLRLDNSAVAIEAKSVTMPSFETETQEFQLVNHMVKFPSIGKWGDISMTLVVTKSKLHQKFLAMAKYQNIKQNGMTLTKNMFGESPPKIEILSETGSPLSTWTLHNPFIQSISFGEFNYESDNIAQVELTISFDHAEIQ